MRPSEWARLEARPAIWEWRAFWSSPVAAPPLHEAVEGPAACERGWLAERYLVFDAHEDDIKLRDAHLHVRQLIERYDPFQAYRTRRSIRFPLATHELLEIFPRLGESDRVFSGMSGLLSALADHGYRPRCYDVRKVRYQRKVRGVELECAKLEVAGRRFWSVAVAGPDLERVASAAADLPDDFTVLGGYARLLAQIDGAA